MEHGLPLVEAIWSLRCPPHVARADPRKPSADPTLTVAAPVRRDGIQPSTRIGERSMCTELLDEPGKGVLDDILSRVGFVQHGKRQPIQTGGVEFEQR